MISVASWVIPRNYLTYSLSDLRLLTLHIIDDTKFLSLLSHWWSDRNFMSILSKDMLHIKFMSPSCEIVLSECHRTPLLMS